MPGRPSSLDFACGNRARASARYLGSPPAAGLCALKMRSVQEGRLFVTIICARPSSRGEEAFSDPWLVRSAAGFRRGETTSARRRRRDERSDRSSFFMACIGISSAAFFLGYLRIILRK